MLATIKSFLIHPGRVQTLFKEENSKPEGILYWMRRDQRAHDNWAMCYAQKMSIDYQIPLHVVVTPIQAIPIKTERHCNFYLKGLEEVEGVFNEMEIHFEVLMGDRPDRMIKEYMNKYKLNCIVTDFCPLKESMDSMNTVKDALTLDGIVKMFYHIDAHNIVPLWEAESKQAYNSRTLRPKITGRLTEFLTHFPPIIQNPYNTDFTESKINWKDLEKDLVKDKSVTAVKDIIPGYEAGMETLCNYLTNGLALFSKRNNPTVKEAVSGLSPYLHFGQISAQTCAREVERRRRNHEDEVVAFLEQFVVRRELSDNFCYYNLEYKSLKGTHDWAQKSLKEHANDKRIHQYSFEFLQSADTDDPLWNAAQNQMVKTGKMHGFMRMYWAKRLLEWTETPEQALEFAIKLNDKYSLDGSDPNGYVGCLWSIGGLHDQAFKDRAIFGKIRFMNFQGCKRKFDIKKYMNDNQ